MSYEFTLGELFDEESRGKKSREMVLLTLILELNRTKLSTYICMTTSIVDVRVVSNNNHYSSFKNLLMIL